MMKTRKQIQGWMAAAAISCTAAFAVEPGDEAPGFTLTSAGGEEVSLSDYEGKIVVLEWLNHDCPFVKKHYESGNMPELQDNYRDQGVVWLTINSSAEGKQGYLPPAEMVELSEEKGSNATAVLMDTDGTVGKAYGATVTPHMYVIGKDGTIKYAGGIDDKPTTELADVETATPYVENALDAVLAGKEVETKTAKPYGCTVKY